MKISMILVVLLVLTGCKAGEFTPERNALYELNRPDCEKTPERCVNGYPW